MSKRFVDRHIGPSEKEEKEMLSFLGYASSKELVDDVIPTSLKFDDGEGIKSFEEGEIGETELVEELQEMMKKNNLFLNFLGMGFYGTKIPSVIQRSLLKNPGWYTQYTPYQAEISQGRLESLINFQTAVSDLTGLPFSNASLLDDGSAAAEAMGMFWRMCAEAKKKSLFVSLHLHPHIIEVVKNRAGFLGIDVFESFCEKEAIDEKFFGAILAYPYSDGGLVDLEQTVKEIKKNGVYVAVSTDLLGLTLLKPPGEWGVDVAFGSAQRLGVPLGFGGPHAAFIACTQEFKRQLPGRVIGVSKDAEGNVAYRMAMQAREQHIRKSKATSNICTAQTLLANMTAMYCVYHGPEGLKSIAQEIHEKTVFLYKKLKKLGLYFVHQHFFDTLTIELSDEDCQKIVEKAEKEKMNFRVWFPFKKGKSKKWLGISLDEVTTEQDLEKIFHVFCSIFSGQNDEKDKKETCLDCGILVNLERKSPFMQHPIFNSIKSEQQMQRYLTKLERRDLSLVFSMIPLGSCTMKLNASVLMMALADPFVSNLHPFVDKSRARGYMELFEKMENYLCKITGFSAFSLQPNSGAQGEYAGLLAIKNYFLDRGERQRNVALIPSSAHGTNFASAVMAGMEVVVTKCDEQGNLSREDIEEKIGEYGDTLAVFMVTYPSTYGIYEKGIQEICQLIHDAGAQVYMDGANMNAQIGYTSPKKIGADVCHLNLHKTFAIPHGGGGPGAGPVGVANHLKDFLPGHSFVSEMAKNKTQAIVATPWGSASILTISYGYIRLLGPQGLKKVTEMAILNANYIKKRLENFYDVLFQDKKGLVAHEMIIDVRPFEKSAGVTVEDVAKRIIDYGFHAPTMSWPVEGTLMIEPTESEDKGELDRFCDAMIAIREEIRKIEKNIYSRQDNPLKNAPHTMTMVINEKWEHSYTREEAAFPVKSIKKNKFWPHVARVDNVYGDRNLFCACPPVDDL